MRRARLSEESFLRIVRRRFGALSPPTPEGIGDDAAVLRPPRGGSLLAAADGLIESVHFRRSEPPWLLGRKALAVNLSDIAAMGGRPTAFLLTLGIPPDLTGRYLESFLAGLASGAREHRVRLAGGDTCASPGPFIISIAILAEVSRTPLTRHGARPGDLVCVSGPLGGSAMGRRLLESGWAARMSARGHRVAHAKPPGGRRVPLTQRTRAAEALRAHLDPVPRLALGSRLRAEGVASSAMDLSDGLALDGWRLAEASGVGLRLIGPAIPIADAARALASATRADPLDLALHGGEDYELLFTVPRARAERLTGLGALIIGHVVSRPRGITLEDAAGRGAPLPRRGFDHFRR